MENVLEILNDVEKDFRAKRTFFNRSQPQNLLTVEQWKTFTRNAYQKTNYLVGVRNWAEIKGGAHVLREDGTLIVFTQRSELNLERTLYPIGSWGWEEDRTED
jgi:hypothetical protein